MAQPAFLATPATDADPTPDPISRSPRSMDLSKVTTPILIHLLSTEIRFPKLFLLKCKITRFLYHELTTSLGIPELTPVVSQNDNAAFNSYLPEKVLFNVADPVTGSLMVRRNAISFGTSANRPRAFLAPCRAKATVTNHNGEVKRLRIFERALERA